MPLAYIFFSGCPVNVKLSKNVFDNGTDNEDIASGILNFITGLNSAPNNIGIKYGRNKIYNIIMGTDVIVSILITRGI